MSGGGSSEGSNGNFGEKLLALLICTIFSVAGAMLFTIPNGFKFRGKRFKPWFPSVKIPSFLGMLLFGVMARNLPGDILEHLDPDWSSALRTVALTVILYRAGLELDVESLKKMGRATGLLTLLPQVGEGVSAGILGWLLMDIPIMLSLAMGFMLGAVSPAVVVQGLVKLQTEGFGVEKGIPTLIMAAASLDDVLAITLFSIFISISFAGAGEGALLGDGIGAIIGTAFIDIFGGIFAGLVIGYCLKYLKYVHQPIIHFVITMTIAIGIVFGAGAIGLHGAGFLAIITYNCMCGKYWQDEKEEDSDELRVEDLDKIENDSPKKLRPEAYLAFGKSLGGAGGEKQKLKESEDKTDTGEENKENGTAPFHRREKRSLSGKRVDFSVKVRSATRSVVKRMMTQNSSQTMRLRSKYSKAEISKALQEEISAPVVFRQATMSFRALGHHEKFLYKMRNLAAKMRAEEGEDSGLSKEIVKGIKELSGKDGSQKSSRKNSHEQGVAGQQVADNDKKDPEAPGSKDDVEEEEGSHSHNPVHYCDEKAAILWGFMVFLLFGLIGAEVKMDNLDGETVGYSFVIVILAGILIRTAVVMVSCYDTGLDFMEKLFVGISFLPKATVQAAIGGQALDLARENKEEYIDYGLKILNISVLSILITAPLGAILIATTGPKWLQQIETLKKPDDIFDTDKASTTDDAAGSLMMKEIVPQLKERDSEEEEDSDDDGNTSENKRAVVVK